LPACGDYAKKNIRSRRMPVSSAHTDDLQ